MQSNFRRKIKDKFGLVNLFGSGTFACAYLALTNLGLGLLFLISTFFAAIGTICVLVYVAFYSVYAFIRNIFCTSDHSEEPF
mgnify:FL=1